MGVVLPGQHLWRLHITAGPITDWVQALKSIKYSLWPHPNGAQSCSRASKFPVRLHHAGALLTAFLQTCDGAMYLDVGTIVSMAPTLWYQT